MDPGQHSNLMPTITGGGGKALCHSVNNENPDPQDLLSYVREVAGKKSDRNFNLGQQPKTKGGIILMRPRGYTEERPWFFDQVDSSLGQSSIEQGELLEVILDADASKLKRPAVVVQPAENTNMHSGRSIRLPINHHNLLLHADSRQESPQMSHLQPQRTTLLRHPSKTCQQVSVADADP